MGGGGDLGGPKKKKVGEGEDFVEGRDRHAEDVRDLALREAE